MGERREAESIPPLVEMTGIVPPHFYAVHQQEEEATQQRQPDAAAVNAGQVEDEPPPTEEQDPAVEAREEEDPTFAGGDTEEEGGDTEEGVGDADDKDDSVPADDDSLEAVGNEEAAEHDRDMMDENNDGSSDADSEGFVAVDGEGVGKVKTMLQKILSLGATGSQSTGQIVVKSDDAADDSPGGVKLSKMASAASAEPDTLGPNARKPTLIHNGRMVRMIEKRRIGFFVENTTCFSFVDFSCDRSHFSSVPFLSDL